MLLPMSPLTTSSASSPRRRNNSPNGTQWVPKSLHLRDERYEIAEKEKVPRASFTASQAFALAALCSSVAVFLTAVVAFSFFSGSFDMYADQLIASTTRSVISRRGVRSLSASSLSSSPLSTSVRENSDAMLVKSRLPETQGPSIDGEINRFPDKLPVPRNQSDGPHPRVAWLMSFPNSGTSFTLHLTREASNCTTATNYALEGDIRDKPSVPALQGPDGANGPWLELIRDRDTNIPPIILTKTHCKGICAGSGCGPHGGIETVRSFMMGCLSGVKAVEKNGRIVKQKLSYDQKLVKKAIHIFRHPLDNVVARFHLDFHDQTVAGNHKFAELFPRNVTGFRRWCSFDDQNLFFLKSRYTDVRLRVLMKDIPCMNEFYRYVQWHNLAFDTSRYLNLPTMLLHYHEYSENLADARDRILDWLELPRIGPGEPFHSGKVYRHYYSLGQRQAIRAFLKEFASAETWEQLQDYDFDTQSQASSS